MADEISIARILLMIISSIMIILVLKIKKDQRVGNQFFFVFLIFWIIILAIASRPTILDDLVNLTGLGNRAQFLLILSMAIIVYLLALQVVKNKSISFSLYGIIREIAITNFKKEFENISKKNIELIIIIVAKNESKSIGNVIDGINSLKLSASYKILVVNDGSTDDTELIARSKDAMVVTHVRNLGIGGATKTGFVACQIFKPQIIINIDADGQHDPSYIPMMISKIKNEGIDLVYASRFSSESNYSTSTVRSFGNRFYTRLVNKIANISITDVTSGYRGLRFEKLKDLFFIAESNFAIELAIRAGKNRLKISEIPVKASGREFGHSQFHKIEKFFIYNINALIQIFNAFFRTTELIKL